MKDYFASLASGLQAAMDQGKASPRKRYALEIARLGKRLYSGEDDVAWCGITAPFDLLAAMGVTSCFVEFVGAMLAAMGAAAPFLEETDRIGYSSDACSYHRAVTGAALKGMMPEPKFLVGTTNPCSGGLAVLENLAARFGKQLFVLHIPQDESGGHVRHLADQIRDLAGFVSEVTGTPLDRERLRAAVGHTNEARAVMEQVYALAKAVPSPVTSRDLGNFGVVMALFLGTPVAVEIARAYLEAFTRRIEDQARQEKGEKFRLLWIQNRIQFKNPIETLLSDGYQASIVVDELNDITWEPIDEDHIFEGLARRSISIPFNGTIQNRVRHLQELALAYRVDGAINPCNWGCRQGSGGRGLIEAGLKEIGVPVLNLEVDCIDARKFTEGQFQTRIEAFIEMMDARRH